MLTFVINGESHQVTADQFRTLVDVAVRIMRDASRDAGVEFTIEGLHASAPTIVWAPQATQADTDVEEAFMQVAHRIDVGVAMLEQDDGVPEWMAGATASALYRAAGFGETAIDGVSFRVNGKDRSWRSHARSRHRSHGGAQTVTDGFLASHASCEPRRRPPTTKWRVNLRSCGFEPLRPADNAQLRPEEGVRRVDG